MKVGVIILAWNSEKRILDCLNSLNSYCDDFNTYVVDNDSKDNTVQIIKKSFPNINLILSNSNLGFSGGNNLGFTQAINDGCDYVVLLNDDVIILEDFISPLVRKMENDKTIGSIGPCFLNFRKGFIS